MCREGGARVIANVMVRDMDVAADHGDARRLEIAADGLPMFKKCSWRSVRRWSLPCDATVRPFPDAPTPMAQFFLQVARRRKERADPELAGPRGRARLVVLAGEGRGRWSEETRDFLNQLARSKVRHEPAVLERRVQQAWRMRWQTILSCGGHSSVQSTLQECSAWEFLIFFLRRCCF